MTGSGEASQNLATTSPSPRKSRSPLGWKSSWPGVQVHCEGLHLEAPQHLDHAIPPDLAKLDRAEVGYHWDIGRDRLDMELIEELGLAEEYADRSGPDGNARRLRCRGEGAVEQAS